ncbi:MAG: hypothetical protein ABL893_02470 [Hyphomicrobium sp.]
MAFASAFQSPLDRVFAVLAGLAGQFSFNGRAPRASAAPSRLSPAAMPAALPRAPGGVSRAPRLSLADQWTKLSGVLNASVANAAAAQSMQQAATRQLDLAQYGLTTLVDELSAVMTVPGRSRRNATLHTLGNGYDVTGGYEAARPVAGRALAA